MVGFSGILGTGWALKFNNIRLIDLIFVVIDQIVVSDKFKHNNEGFKYFIGYQEGGIVKPLCIISPKWVDTSNTLKAVVKHVFFD